MSAADTKPGGNKKINHCHHVKKNSFKKPMPFIDIFVIIYSVPIQTKKKNLYFLNQLQLDITILFEVVQNRTFLLGDYVAFWENSVSSQATLCMCVYANNREKHTHSQLEPFKFSNPF